MVHHMQSTTGRLHIPLLAELLEAARHHDQDLLDDFRHGFPVIGEMTAGGPGKAGSGRALRAGKQAHGRYQICRTSSNDAGRSMRQPSPEPDQDPTLRNFGERRFRRSPRAASATPESLTR